ncbi:hypothetical protein HYG87_04530 [Methanobacterium alkalithermotolerans]|uniref:Uncharacterized protein n=1 Tax=Methanobacterium alkalithermotolerans TaxID=2731220 RepID=A0A8T8K3I1_9EURY|nr:hypothetical protein [Methanobacterium alkalithermotolerans]QUH23086.1 hypothetical protein HYG87_04530 [Methanobacterium alkalithermotolerans]
MSSTSIPTEKRPVSSTGFLISSIIVSPSPFSSVIVPAAPILYWLSF